MAVAAPIIAAVTAQTVQGMVLRFALSLAVSFITQKLFGPEAPPGAASANGGSAPDPGVKQRIPSDPSNKLPIVYGEDKVHGSIIFADISSDNQTMGFIITLCEGPIKGINDIYWDDYKLVFDTIEVNDDLENVVGTIPGNNVIDAIHPDGSHDDWLKDQMKVHRYPYGGRCVEMEAFSSKWAAGAADRTMPDVAYAYCELKYDREKQVTGLTSKLAFEIEGRLVRELELVNNDIVLRGRSPKDGITDIGLANPTLFSTTPKFYDYQGGSITGTGYWPTNAYGYASYYEGFQSRLPQDLMVPGGTYEIIDLGLNMSIDIDDYKNGSHTNQVGSYDTSEVEFDFVQPGEQYKDFSTGNYVTFQPTVPDDGRRILNGLNIKDSGYGLTESVIRPSNINETRVWVKYTYLLNGVSTDYYLPLITDKFINSGYFNFNGVNDFNERDFAVNFLESIMAGTAHDFDNTDDNPNGYLPIYAEGIEKFGIRRDRMPYHVADANGVEPTFQYEPGQQYYTEPLPISIKAYASGDYSQTPPECLIDYLTHYTYGCGESVFDNDLDLQTFYDHKLFCNTLVTHNDTTGTSVSSKQYQTNGYANTGDDKDLNISDLNVNSQSIFSYTLGKFQMISDKVDTVKKIFDHTNIYGDITLINDGFNSTINEMTLKFKSKAENYQDDQVFLDYGFKYFNEPELAKDISLKFLNTNVEAQRMGSVLMNKSRSNKIISFRTDTRAAELQVNDVIEVNGTYYDLSQNAILTHDYVNAQSSLSSTASIGEYKMFDSAQQMDVRYSDNTPAHYFVPYTIVKFDDLLTYFKECINGQFFDRSGTLSKYQVDQNNKLGEIFSLVTFVEGYTGNVNGGQFQFHINSIVFSGDADANISIKVVNNISNTTFIGVISQFQDNDNGTQFRVNSISEVELDGGLQGYYLTAQIYNPNDYNVGALTQRANAPTLNAQTYSTIDVVTNLVLNSTSPLASIPSLNVSFTIPASSNIEGVEVYYSEGIAGAKKVTNIISAPGSSYAANSVQTIDITSVPTTTDLYIWIRSFNTFARGDYSTGLSVGAWNPANAATNVGNNAVSQNSIQNQAVGSNQIQNNSIGTNQIAQVVDFTGKTVTLPASAVKAHTGEWDITTKTADFTVTNQAYWQGYFIDTTSNTVTITLPTAPDDGDIIKLIDVGVNAATNNIIIDGNGKNIQGSSSNYNINTNRSGTEFIFLTGKGWILTHN
jgi:hypothetical protein